MRFVPNTNVVWAALITALLAVGSVSLAQDRGENNGPAAGNAANPTSTKRLRNFIREGGDLRDAFAPLASSVRSSVVKVRDGWNTVSLGTIVDSSGLILTKASTLPASPRCVLPSGRLFDARIVAQDLEYDVALLQIDAEELTPVTFPSRVDHRVGSWLVTVGTGRVPISVGVTSVPPRQIPHRRGFLGVSLERSNRSAGGLVTDVIEDSAAEACRLQVGDVVTAVNGKSVNTADECIAQIGKLPPGAEILLRVDRGYETLSLRTTLGQRPEDEEPFEDYGQGDLSMRRGGFPSALQHDAPIDPDECGGPVLDVSGRVVGINIARSGRTQTLALPADVVARLIAKLRLESRRA